jgi:DAK2 domain fusion protein YloV
MSLPQPNASNSGFNGALHCEPVNGQRLKEFLRAGLTWLKANQQVVNLLNVFPVPDGDTGTNMVLTMQAAYDEIAASDERNIGKVAHGIAQGALMGARGNSGVILSQLWRGFARGLDNLDTMDATIFVKALVEARHTAYKGVVRPVEGTILTVAKDIAISAEQNLHDSKDLGYLLEKIVESADISVKHTPELLPILKTAGVVDSGGKGLFFIFEGILRYIKGLSLDTPVSTLQPITAMNLENTVEEIEPGQDFEIVVDFHPNHSLDLDSFYRELSEMGTSIQIGEGDGMYRMHIHVPEAKRYDPIDYIMKLGTVTKTSIENLRAQMMSSGQDHDYPNLIPVEPGQIALVAVSPGPGISRIFASLGATALVNGGQTMNPSTEEILAAFENLPTDKVIILPNNKNVILAAQSTVSLTVKHVVVIPSNNVPQGLSAMLRLAPDGELDDVVTEMTEALSEVEAGEITTATRSVQINGVQVEQGQVIGLLNGKLVHSSQNVEDTLLGLLQKASTKDKERITFLYGNNIRKAEVDRLVDLVRSVYTNQEIEVHEGGQPHYQFILSIE